MSVLNEVAVERARQDVKWGEQNHAPQKWLVILGEEFGESCRGSCERDLAQYRKELIQVAAVAVAAVESLDRNQARSELLRMLEDE